MQIHHFRKGFPAELEVSEKLVRPQPDQMAVPGLKSGPDNYWVVTPAKNKDPRDFSGALLVARTVPLVRNPMMDDQYTIMEAWMAPLGEVPSALESAANAVIYAGLIENNPNVISGRQVPRELVGPLGQVGMRVSSLAGPGGHVEMQGDGFPVLRQVASLLHASLPR